MRWMCGYDVPCKYYVLRDARKGQTLELWSQAKRWYLPRDHKGSYSSRQNKIRRRDFCVVSPKKSPQTARKHWLVGQSRYGFRPNHPCVDVGRSREGNNGDTIWLDASWLTFLSSKISLP